MALKSGKITDIDTVRLRASPEEISSDTSSATGCNGGRFGSTAAGAATIRIELLGGWEKSTFEKEDCMILSEMF